MEPLTEKFTYVDPNFDITVVARQATALDGMRRAALIGQVTGEAQQQREGDDAEALLEGFVRYHMGMVWTACRATLHEVIVNDEAKPGRIVKNMTLDQFAALPDPLVQMWEAASLRLNPHWAPKMPDEDAGGSKQPATTSSDG